MDVTVRPRVKPLSKLKLRQTPQPLERRRFKRARVAVVGRYMLENKQEFPCLTVDVSAGGLLLTGPGKGRIGEKVVLYFDTFGRIEGEIVRQTPDGFAISFTMPAAKRDKMADLLTWMINHDYVGLPEDRRHRRITPTRTQSLMRVTNGQTIPVEVVDVSVSGVGLRTDNIPPVGARVEIGRRAGRVVRHFNGGLAVEFARLIPIEEFDEDIIL